MTTDYAQELDLLHGAREIGAFLKTNPRKTYYLLETGALPAFKLGNQWCARKSTLLAYFAQLEEQAATKIGQAAG